MASFSSVEPRKVTLLSGETLGPSALIWVTCLLSLLPTLSLLPGNEDSVVHVKNLQPEPHPVKLWTVHK